MFKKLTNMDMNSPDPFDKNKPYNQLPLLPPPDKVIDNEILLRDEKEVYYINIDLVRILEG